MSVEQNSEEKKQEERVKMTEERLSKKTGLMPRGGQ